MKHKLHSLLSLAGTSWDSNCKLDYTSFTSTHSLSSLTQRSLRLLESTSQSLSFSKSVPGLCPYVT